MVKKIIIVGGGLAGFITGLQLQHADSQKELDITILERAKEPYTTLCGEGLSDSTLNLFQPIFDSKPYVAQEFEGATWEFPGGHTFVVHQKCYTMARSKWIPAMAERFAEQGGRVEFGKLVKKEDVNALAQEYYIVIGADGPASVVRQSMAGANAKVCVGIQYRVVDSDYKTNWLEFYTDKKYSNEYAWIFPRGEMINVGILSSTGYSWEQLNAFMEAKGVGGRVLRREGYSIGFGGNKVLDGNKMLIGDAAGLTNPLTKGGMAAIMYASQILVKCITQNKVSDYQKEIFSHPITSPNFQKSLDIIKRSTNDVFEKMLIKFPKEIHVGENRSKLPYMPQVIGTMLRHPSRANDLLTLYRSMGLSRKYSW